jgi:hypothetical protein
VSDLHLRILRHVARRTQRELDDHDGLEHPGESTVGARRRELARLAAQARGQASAAQARRRRQSPRNVRDPAAEPKEST